MLNAKTALTFLKGVATKKAPMYVQFALAIGITWAERDCSRLAHCIRRSHLKSNEFPDYPGL